MYTFESTLRIVEFLKNASECCPLWQMEKWENT